MNLVNACSKSSLVLPSGQVKIIPSDSDGPMLMELSVNGARNEKPTLLALPPSSVLSQVIAKLVGGRGKVFSSSC